MSLRVAIEPNTNDIHLPRATEELISAWRANLAAIVEKAGGTVTSPSEADALIWLAVGAAGRLLALLDGNPDITWVQLPWAGVDAFTSSGLFDRPVVFTSAKGVLADQVAEHALMLMLQCHRGAATQARTRGWREVDPISLSGRRVTILGAGGIASRIADMVEPLGCPVTILRRRPDAPIAAAGTHITVSSIDNLDTALPNTDVLVLAMALTTANRKIIGAHELGLLPPGAVIVNIARGALIDTDALVQALTTGTVTAAGLDVTDPEPLPDDHPLWSLDNVVITSHCADSPEFVTRQVSQRVAENIDLFVRGEPLAGVVDVAAGY